jgi:SAM-dependent methyltransferase
VIRYTLAAAALKSFSLTPATRSAYRRLGNVVETARRLRGGEVPEYYFDEVVKLSQLMRTNQVIADGDRVFELGTGFVHWQSVVAKLFADVRPIMFDVVDDRLWKVFLTYMAELKAALPRLDLPDDRIAPAQQLLDRLLASHAFDEAYEVLGAEYILHPDGSFDGLESESFALVTSLNVLEHINAEILPQVMAETYRLLRPGGYVIHQFDLSDHYWYFDSSMSRKNYLRFAPDTWDRWLSNRVMYINRVQRPQWETIFKQANFEIVDCEVEREPLGDIAIHPEYALSPDDAQTVVMRYTLRRP